MFISPITFTQPLQYACSRFSSIFACTSCPNCTRFFSLLFPPFSSLAPCSSSRCCHHCDRTLHNKHIFSSLYRCLFSIRSPLLWPGSFRSEHSAGRQTAARRALILRSGQLGNGDTRSSPVPVTVTAPSIMQSASPSSASPHFTRVAAGGNTSAAIDTFGS